ncbi:hypothetical protein ACSBL2_13430 [Pedobacter sp. AW31-3R]|uniref:hypothetical protein n=1 Tax=Pedobacter sp. AW31-3R TaxID=3445781 RepID=UPI003FA0A685
MAIRIISAVLILFSVYIGISHGSRVFGKPTESYLEMMTRLGITDTLRIGIGVWSIASGILILFPPTFFMGNLSRAFLLIAMMALALKAGNYKFALVEVPFLPLLLIYLGYS